MGGKPVVHRMRNIQRKKGTFLIPQLSASSVLVIPANTVVTVLLEVVYSASLEIQFDIDILIEIFQFQ